MFPNKKDQILQYYGLKSAVELTKKMRSSPVEFIQAWTHEAVGWRLGQNLVLEVAKNPHWDYKGQDYGSIDPQTGTPITKKVYFNHLKKLKMPFLFLNHINTTGHAYDDTTILEQGIGLQNWINKRKRQIGENADAANGVWVSSGDFISQEEFEKVEGGINEKIWLENGLPANGIARITGNSLEDFVYQDLLDSRNALNELMGINAATIGTKTNNDTLGKDMMDRQQSIGRADGYVRDGIEVFAQEWFNYMYHMYLVYRTDEISLAIPEDDDFETENIVFSRSNVPVIQKKNGDMVICPMVIRVKQGSTLPQDEIAEYQKAQNMKDLLAPIDYLKKVGEANPRELAKNSLINAMDPTWFFKDDPDVIAIQQAQAQKAMMAAQAAGGATPPPALEDRPGGSPDGSSAEGVANALRAEAKDRGIDPKELQSKMTATQPN